MRCLAMVALCLWQVAPAQGSGAMPTLLVALGLAQQEVT
jgi:hypothetical protein